MTTPAQQKNPVEILEKQVRLLEQIYQEQHSSLSRQQTPQKREFSLSKHAGSCAIIAALIATLWVMEYVLTTVYGYGGFGSPLLEYVTGQAHNMETFGSEAAFVITTRFVLAFGFSWFTTTLIIATIRKFI